MASLSTDRATFFKGTFIVQKGFSKKKKKSHPPAREFGGTDFYKASPFSVVCKGHTFKKNVLFDYLNQQFFEVRERSGERMIP